MTLHLYCRWQKLINSLEHLIRITTSSWSNGLCIDKRFHYSLQLVDFDMINSWIYHVINGAERHTPCLIDRSLVLGLTLNSVCTTKWLNKKTHWFRHLAWLAAVQCTTKKLMINSFLHWWMGLQGNSRNQG